MLKLDNPKWTELKNAYGDFYNPVKILKKLETSNNHEKLWKELWDNLHHQGDINDASFACVTYLIQIQNKNHKFDWNFYSLVAAIEIERRRKNNPEIPGWLIVDYFEALKKLFEIGYQDLIESDDTLMIRSILSVFALLKSDHKFATLLLNIEESEIEDYLNDLLGYSEIYS